MQGIVESVEEPLTWTTLQRLPAPVLAARLWPSSATKPERSDGSWSTIAPCALGESTSGSTAGGRSPSDPDPQLSQIIALMPDTLRERLRPSRLERYALCPLRARYDREEWRVRADAWNPARSLGTAVHAGVSATLTGAQDPHQTVQEALSRDFREGTEWTLGKLEKVALKGVEATLQQLQSWGPYVSEHRLWLGRPDLVGPDDLIDIKCHLKGATRYVDQWGTSLQLWGYVDEAQRYYQRTFKWFYVLDVTLTPKVAAQLVPFKITPERLTLMRAALRQVTASVIRGEEAANPHGCYHYGRCPAFEMCYDFGWDTKRALTLYTRDCDNMGDASGCLDPKVPHSQKVSLSPDTDGLCP